MSDDQEDLQPAEPGSKSAFRATLDAMTPVERAQFLRELGAQDYPLDPIADARAVMGSGPLNATPGPAGQPAKRGLESGRAPHTIGLDGPAL